MKSYKQEVGFLRRTRGLNNSVANRTSYDVVIIRHQNCINVSFKVFVIFTLFPRYVA